MVFDSVAGDDQAWLVIANPDGTREHVRLTLALTTLGRSEQNVIELLDPKLSRFHCEIERRADGHYVRDCNSRNGTLVNGELATHSRRLAENDRIKIGRTLVTFHTERPPSLRSDPAIDLHPSGGEETCELDTPHTGIARPTTHYDRRNTQTMAPLRAQQEDPWRFLAETSLKILDATNRAALLELAVESARHFYQAKGALLALGKDPDTLTITAGLGVAGETKQLCLDLARRILVARHEVLDERRLVGVPVRGAHGQEGALVLHDLGAKPVEDSKELAAFQTLADLVGRTLTSSLLLEEVRREERGAGARRIARDLRTALRAELANPIPGLQVARVSAPAEDVGPDFWDSIKAPPRAGREEVYFALGDVPDAGAPPKRGLRRRGERSFVSLLGQAELRGALRAMVEVFPRTAELLVQLNRALHHDGAVDRLALVVARYDPTNGRLRFAGAGHEPVFVRRKDGSVESLPAVAPVLGLEEHLRVSERDLRWEPGDQVLFVSTAATQAGADLQERREEIGDMFARLGGIAHSVDVVGQRIVDALLRQARREQVTGLTVLLLRRV